MIHSDALPRGTLLSDYRIEDVLGSGGFGITYAARDLRLDAIVAVKEYFPGMLALRNSDHSVVSRSGADEEGYRWGRNKFKLEARSLAKLQHHNIVGVNRIFEANGTFYMALDFVEGPSLKQWLRELKRWPDQSELDALFYPLVSALEEVHAKKLLHRDIAPKNIMIARSFSPVLIDFGAARQEVAQRSQTFAAVLTPGYAPFEQYSATGQGQGEWTDIYSLSATFYEAISGHPPPEAPDRTLEDKCTPPAEAGAGHYDPQFLDALAWGLEPLPKYRPQSIAEWMSVLGGNDPHQKSQNKPSKFSGQGRSWLGNLFRSN